MMSEPTRVYFDVENTLRVPFISGIQRVVRELSRRLTCNTASGFEFTPVIYCSHCQGWRKLSSDETELLNKLNQADGNIATPLPYYRKLAGQLLGKNLKAMLRNMQSRMTHPAWHKENLLPAFELGSIFLDLDASWQNELPRGALLPALKANGVFIAVLHYDITPVLFPELTHKDTQPLFIEHLHAHLLHSDLFLCISKKVEEDLLEYCQQQFPSIRLNTTTIKLGADIVNGLNANNSWPLPEEKIKYILSVGTIQPRKNYDFLLDAFDLLSSKFPDISLVIVGNEGWQAEKTIARIQQHALLGKLLFWLPGIDDVQLSNLYKKAYLTVVPSLYEGFGLPVTEALQRGCVTLSSDRGALTEAGGDYVDYFNPEGLHEFTDLLEFYLNSQVREKQKLRLEKFNAPTWSNTVIDLIEILDDNYLDKGI